MKGSERNTFSGTVTLSYSVKNVLFKNQTSIDINKGKESKLNLVCPYYYDVILETQTDLSLNQIAPNGFPKKFQGEKNTSEISCALDDFTRLGLLDLEMNYTATR